METDHDLQVREGKARRLDQAFYAIFGHPSRRTTDQKLVLECLSDYASDQSPIFVADKEGRFDPLRAAHVDGGRAIFLLINRKVKRAVKAQSPQSKPKIKK
jgi:hypothetical protein